MYLGPVGPVQRRWHCYTHAYETVYSETVEAGDAARAAEAAAERSNIAGVWVVIELGERGVARIDVRERKGYEAISVEAGPS